MNAIPDSGLSSTTIPPHDSGPRGGGVTDRSKPAVPTKTPRHTDVVDIRHADERGDQRPGRAHGVVRQLNADHFKPNAESRLRSHFGHLLESPPSAEVSPPVNEANETTEETRIDFLA